MGASSDRTGLFPLLQQPSAPQVTASDRPLRVDSGVMSEAEWSHCVRSFLDEYFALHPPFAAGAGRPEHARRTPGRRPAAGGGRGARLAEWSPEGLAQLVGWMREQRERVLDFSSLEGPLCLEREH